MKQVVTFEFDLPDDQDALNELLAYRLNNDILSEYQVWLRQVCKYEDPAKVDAEACRAKLFEIIQENRP